jgi:toxin FitB
MVGSHPLPRFFTTTMTVAEVLYGVELLAKGKRRSALESAANVSFQEDFAGRVLPFDVSAALLYPRIAAERRKAGGPMTPLDAQIASICLSRGAHLATRNIPDFENCGVELINPWERD